MTISTIYNRITEDEQGIDGGVMADADTDDGIHCTTTIREMYPTLSDVLHVTAPGKKVVMVTSPVKG